MRRLVGFWNEGAAARLRKALEEKGIGTEEFAGRIGVSAKSVRNWLRTDVTPKVPELENFTQLCKELALPQDEFRNAAEEYARRRHAGEIAAALEQPHAAAVATSASVTVHPKPQHLWVWGAALLTVILLPVVWRVTRQSREPTSAASPAVTFTIAPELSGVYDRAFGGDVSPDGTQIAFVARSPRTMKRMLFVYSVADRAARPLAQSEGNYTSFFWSPDSQSIFFITKVDLMKISVGGDAPERIGYVGEGLKGTVNRDGVVILGSHRGLMRVIPGKEAELVTHVQPGEVAHSYPSFLPDGDRVLFTVTRNAACEAPSRWLAVFSLKSRAHRILFPISSRLQYVQGQLLYARSRTLFARPLDADSLTFTGPEKAIANPVWYDSQVGDAGFSASASTLFIVPPARIPPLHHVWADGAIESTINDPPDIDGVAVGHTNNRLAIVGRDEDSGEPTLWLYPLDSRERIRLIESGSAPSSPTFSPDDSVLYYACTGTSWANIYAIDLQSAARKPRLVRPSEDIIAPRDVSHDGRLLLFQQWHNRDGNIWSVPVDDPNGARALVATPEDEGESARFSPDGKHVAFVGKRSGIFSVFVVDFPPGNQLAQQVSNADGWRARWSDDGKRIDYARGRNVIEVDLTSHRSRTLFTMDREISILETARDGGFFVRETSIEQPRTVATAWWPRLAGHPLVSP